MTRALNGLNGRGTKWKGRSFDPLLADASFRFNNVIAEYLGDRAEHQLRDLGHTITGLRVNTLFMRSYVKSKEKTIRKLTGRSHGITTDGPTHPKFCHSKEELRPRRRRKRYRRKPGGEAEVTIVHVSPL